MGQVLAIAKLGDQDWTLARRKSEKRVIESLMAFVVIGFCLSLKVEEVSLICIDSLLTYWQETKESDPPYVMVVLSGKFKGEDNLWWHCILCVLTWPPVSKFFPNKFSYETFGQCSFDT